MCWLFSVGSSTLLWPWEADLNGPHICVPLPSGFALELVNREHIQEIRGREESEVGLLLLPVASHAGCPDLCP